MKDIKFRYVCFNKHFQEIELVYLTDEDLRIVLAKELGTSFELRKDDKHHIPSWILSDNCEIRGKQLYTGLEDKNGKEIYEGDIIRNYEGDLQKIRFDGGRYSCDIIKKATSYWPAQFLDCTYMQWEVVGNIYENPELLSDDAQDSIDNVD